jgi:membrane-associated phospholipid phosphatase
MKKETYIKITQPFRDHPEVAKGLHIINRLCMFIMYVSYPFLLISLYIKKEVTLTEVFLIPAISFVLLSLGRYFINRKRPYEAFDVPPVIPKKTKGKSFPSRHVFSATIIAMTYFMMSPWAWLGIILMVVALVEALVRVLSGVHYISDVIAGMAVGVLASLFYLM